MTCIVGIAEKGRVWMGADSAAVDDRYELSIRHDRKLFRNGQFLIGFTSSFRMGQLLQFKFRPPKPHADRDAYEYMVADFAESVRECLKAGGYAKRENERDSGGTFLVGFSGRLFCIESDFQVGETACGYVACGSGVSVALGALHATQRQRPPERIKAALEAAHAHNANVRPPFVFEETAP